MTHAELTLILRKLEEIRALLALLVEAQNKSGGILSPEGRGTSDDKDGFPV